MNTPIILTALLLLVPAGVVTTDAALDASETECLGTPCDQINRVCERLFGMMCLGAAPGGPDVPDVTDAAPTDCAASACGDVNEYVCQPLFETDCLAAGSTDASADCYGTPCDQINRVCERLGGGQCLGMEAETDGIYCFYVEPWYQVCKVVVGTPNALCEDLTGQECLKSAEVDALAAAHQDDSTSCAIVYYVDPAYRTCSAAVAFPQALCNALFHQPCLQSDEGAAVAADQDDGIYCLQVYPYSVYCGAVVGAVQGACETATGRECLQLHAEVEVADCAGVPCDGVNTVCETAGRGPCVR